MVQEHKSSISKSINLPPPPPVKVTESGVQSQKAYMVLVVFLLLKKDEEEFENWLKKMCNAKSDCRKACSQCLKEYCEIRMQSTSKKHDNFVKELIGNKSVRKLPGIGDTYGGRLERQGIDKAYMVLVVFLLLKKDEEEFENWLKKMCNAKSDCRKACSQCLKEWCKLHL